MLRHRTITGVLWNLSQTLSQRGIAMVITLLLARFLAPADYGLMAMLSVFLAVASSIMDSGFREALIQKREASPIDFATAFWANLVLGAVAYVVLFGVAPLVASFYDEPRLTSLLRAVGLMIPVNSLQVVPIAALSRRLDFKSQLLANVPAGLLSGIIAVAMAYTGAGVWALVAQMLIASLITSALMLRMKTWSIAFAFDRRSFDAMFRFGRNMFLSGLLEIIFSNAYVVVIAKLFSSAIAGYFFFAQRIRDLVLQQIVGSIQTVTYPAFVAMQGDDRRLKEGYRKIIKVMTFVLFPAVLFLAALARPLFDALLPAAWSPAVVYLQLGCFAGVLYPLHSVNLNVLKVKGRSDMFLYLEVFKKVLLIAVLAASVPFGVLGILYGQIVLSVLAYIPNSVLTDRLIGYPVREQLADILPALLLAAGVAGAIYFGVERLDWRPAAKLIGGGTFGPLVYLGGAALLKLDAMQLIGTLIYQKLAGRTQHDASPSHR